MQFGPRAYLRPYSLLISAVLLLASCTRQAPAKTYEIDGRVVAIDVASRQLTIAHKDIPGVMPAMTMPFVVAGSDAWVFNAIAPGDQVHATLVFSDHPELRNVTFSRGSDLPSDGTSQIHIPQPGDAVPDFALTNQNGAVIRMRQFRGKPLLLTFIYTRCPFPDFCPRMSHNFAQVLQGLEKDPKTLSQAQLLSISIDPEHDKTPELRAYGEGYAGKLDPRFQHWQFASGSPEQVRKAADFFGLAYNSKEGQIVHNLSTALIDPDGKIVKLYRGGGWRPDEVAKDFVAAMKGSN